MTATLRDRCGIVSNRVDGVWTGVSLARFKRLVHLLSSDVSESIDLSSSSRGMCVPLFLQCVWERAESKRCILDFLLALDEHVGCLEPRWRDAFETDAGAVQEWCAETFKPGDTDESAVEMAARRVLHHQRAQGLEPFAHAVEVVAANLCDVHAFKPPNVLERHGYQGGEPRPDCVEMLLRELFDMLLFDPITQTFDVGRLPSSSAQALRDHFHRRNDGSLPPEYAGAEWFPLCQEHVPVCRYLSRTPDGSAYELYPSLSNLAAAAGVLLGQESRGWTSLSQLQTFWNQLLERRADDSRRGLRLLIDESRSGPYRPQLSDQSRMREIAEIRLEGSRFGVEFLLEADPPIAIATHRRIDRPWEEATSLAHLAAWQNEDMSTRAVSKGSGRLHIKGSSDGAELSSRDVAKTTARLEEASRRRVLDVIWPVVLGERLLDALSDPPRLELAISHVNSKCSASEAHVARAVQAVLSSRWTDEQLGSRSWNPSVEANTIEDAHATMAEAARQRGHSRAAKAVAALSRAPTRISEPMITWMLRRLPEGLEAVAIAEALLTGPETAALGEKALKDALSTRDDAHVVAALVGFAHGRLTLVQALSALQGTNVMYLARLAVTTRLMPFREKF